AGHADNTEEFTGRNFQVEAAQHGRENGVLAIGLMQVDGGQHGSHLRADGFSDASQKRRDVRRFCEASLNRGTGHSKRRARTGCSMAARSAGSTLNRTATTMAPRFTSSTFIGWMSVGMRSK